MPPCQENSKSFFRLLQNADGLDLQDNRAGGGFKPDKQEEFADNLDTLIITLKMMIFLHLCLAKKQNVSCAKPKFNV